MSVQAFEDRVPAIDKTAYVHPSAVVIGGVTIGASCWIGPGASLRGDYGEITIGPFSAIEDNCVVHARPGERTTIGRHVTIGHAAVIHNATINDYAVIGMRAVVSDWATVGIWSVVAEGAVVRQRQEIPPDGIAVGVPARLLDKTVDEAYKAEWTRFKQTYVDLARRYRVALRTVG